MTRTDTTTSTSRRQIRDTDTDADKTAAKQWQIISERHSLTRVYRNSSHELKIVWSNRDGIGGSCRWTVTRSDDNKQIASGTSPTFEEAMLRAYLEQFCGDLQVQLSEISAGS